MLLEKQFTGMIEGINRESSDSSFLSESPHVVDSEDETKTNYNYNLNRNGDRKNENQITESKVDQGNVNETPKDKTSRRSHSKELLQTPEKDHNSEFKTPKSAKSAQNVNFYLFIYLFIYFQKQQTINYLIIRININFQQIIFSLRNKAKIQNLQRIQNHHQQQNLKKPKRKNIKKRVWILMVEMMKKLEEKKKRKRKKNGNFLVFVDYRGKIMMMEQK